MSTTSQALPSVSVALATHERRDLLERVLPPLLADEATTEVVVVVDGSRDGSLEVLQKMAKRDSRVQALLIEPAGRSRAQQEAIDRTSGEVVLLLDDDVMAGPGLVSGHARHHAVSRGLVVVGYMPPLLPGRRAPGQFAAFQYADEYEAICADYDRDSNRVLLDLWGGNVSIRRVDLSRVPLHSDDDTLYHSDRDFGLRCRKAGLVGIFDRSLSAQHLYSRSLEGFVRDARLQGAGHFRVHQLHGDLIGELELDDFQIGSRRRTTLIIRACRFPLLRSLISGALRVLVRVAGFLPRYPLETRAAVLLQSIEQQRGAQELLARQNRFRTKQSN